MVNSKYGKVAVLMGGCSAERDISLKSGAVVLGALQRQGVDAHAVDAAQIALTELQDYDRVFIALHGRGGEDGLMQGALELLQVPYTGSGVLGSALGMDKVKSKLVWKGIGLPTPNFMLLQAGNLDQVIATLGLPLMVKPAQEGSSIGMQKVTEASQLMAAWENAGQYDSSVIAEAWIEGGEYTAAILNGVALPLIRLTTPNSFYDYAAKYQAETTQYLCPCGLRAEQERALQALSLQAFAAVDASGWGRVDFMLDSNDAPWLLEVNTVPGMTDHSLVPMAAKAAGKTLEQLVLDILSTSFYKIKE